MKSIMMWFKINMLPCVNKRHQRSRLGAFCCFQRSSSFINVFFFFTPCHLTAPGSKFQSSSLMNKVSLQPGISGDLCVWWRQTRLSGTNQFQPRSFHSKAGGVFLEHLPKSDMFDSFSSPLLQVLHTPFAWCWSLSPGEKSKGQLLQFVRNTSYLSELHQSQHGAGACVCVWEREGEKERAHTHTTESYIDDLLDYRTF